MEKINYLFKSYVLKSEEYSLFQKYSRKLYIIERTNYFYNENGEQIFTYTENKEWQLLREWINKFSRDKPKEYKECIRLWNSHIQRVKRLKDRIETMLLSGDCLFLSITWNNDFYNKHSFNTKKRYVKSFLSSLNCPYVANLDYGKKNGRLHYHAVVQTEYLNPKDWEFGNLDIQRIRNNNEDTERLSKYIAKLTNHAIKETTKRNSIIYSRVYQKKLIKE